MANEEMSIGAQLRAARMKRRMHINTVSRRTKIQPWVLESLEADELPSKMSPIYVKGFLMTYAKCLRLDPQPLVDRIVWPRREFEQNIPPPPKRQFSLPQFSLPGWFSWALVRRVAVAAVSGGAILALIIANPIRRTAGLQKKKSAGASLASLSPVSAVAPKHAAPVIAAESERALELELTVKRATWVWLRADGKLVTQEKLERGAAERWSAKKHFELVIAKPSRVELSLNGRSISPQAIAYRGRLEISRKGIEELAYAE